MKILGVNCVSHDASAALIINGILDSAVEEERFNRKKHTNEFPQQSIDFCLEHAGISDVDYIGIPLRPELSMSRTFERLLTDVRGNSESLDDMLEYYPHLFTNIRKLADRFDGTLYFTGHHEAHLASAFYPSPFDRAALLSIDGSGDDLTTVFAVGEGNRIQILDQIQMPESIGYLYMALTQFLGFKPNSDEGKVMGLAPYGNPDSTIDFDKLAWTKNYGNGFGMNFKQFRYHRGFNRMFEDSIKNILGEPRKARDEITRKHQNIAYTLQAKTEEIVFNMLRWLQKETGYMNLCLAGGVGLNSVMNGKITDMTGFNNLYVPVAPSDTGTSLGSAMWIEHMILGNPRRGNHSPYLGPSYSNVEIKAEFDKAGVEYTWIDNPDKAAAQMISEGYIIGWFQGRTEIGARALGNRSILSDPRDPEMKDRLNAKVKHREAFRPFAPSVLAEYQNEYFEKGDHTYYMSEVFKIRPEKRNQIPSVVHVDGSGRLQTVTQELNPIYHNLITEFYQITGVPIVINTSLNDNGEPIVNHPRHAINCVMNTGMDALIIGNYLFKKQDEASD